MNLHVAVAVTTMFLSGVVTGQVVVDGTLDSDMPAHATLQTVATGFNDSDYGQPGFCNGSELDAVHIDYRDGSVVIFLAGNLESNYNKLELFVDARPGGQNQLRHDNPIVDYDGLNRMGDLYTGACCYGVCGEEFSCIQATNSDCQDLSNSTWYGGGVPCNDSKVSCDQTPEDTPELVTPGLKFDDEFEPDIWISVTCSDDGQGGFVTHASYSQLHTEGGGSGFYLGSGSSGAAIINGENGIQIAIDNSNVGGVGSGTGPDCGLNVTTGIEIVIPQFVIDWNHDGLPFDDIKVCAFINGSSHNYLSNQFLGGLGPLYNNLGEPRGLDLNGINGEQFARMGDVMTDCPPVGDWGSCCLGEACFETMDPQNCTDGGGVYNADTPCSDDPCGIPDCPTDINDDGETNVDDLLELLAHYGESCI